MRDFGSGDNMGFTDSLEGVYTVSIAFPVAMLGGNILGGRDFAAELT